MTHGFNSILFADHVAVFRRHLATFKVYGKIGAK
jgi:hypothetical protein